MPSVSGKTSLLAKYGKRLDAAAKKAAPEEYKQRGFVNLPAGIKNGVAQLTECGFEEVPKGQGKANEGEVYFFARGVVVSPESVMVDGEMMKVKGLQTSIIEMVCDTTSGQGKKTTLEEHVYNIENHMKGLGAQFDNPDEVSHTDLEAMAETLVEQAPHFHFTTTTSTQTRIDPKTKRPYPPRVFENWRGVAEDWQPGSEMSNGEVVDETGEDQGGATGEGDDAGTDPDADGALTELAEKADKKDKAAAKQLKAVAIEAGIGEKEVDGATDWTAVVAMIREKAGFGEEAPDEEEEEESEEGETDVAEEPEPEPEPAVPTKGSVWKYAAPDPKTGKKGKAKEYEVVTVSEKNRLVTLKDNDTKKVLMNPKTKKPAVVGFDDLVVV